MVRHSLPTVSPKLVRLGYDPASYQRIYMGAVSGLFPAEQTHSNRWSILDEDLPKVAEALGLKRRTEAKASDAPLNHVTA